MKAINCTLRPPPAAQRATSPQPGGILLWFFSNLRPETIRPKSDIGRAEYYHFISTTYSALPKHRLSDGTPSGRQCRPLCENR